MLDCRSKICRGIAIMILLLITILIAISLGLIIKYAYLDQIDHYQTAYCYQTNCTSTPINSCSGCYNITVTFHSYLPNVSNYTKTDWTIDQKWYNHCFNFEKDILCYYDDRNVFDSLRLFNRYVNPYGAILAIALAMGLFITSVATIMAGCHYFCFQNPKEIDFEKNDLY